jgi:hypothetical protein
VHTLTDCLGLLRGSHTWQWPWSDAHHPYHGGWGQQGLPFPLQIAVHKAGEGECHSDRA